VGSINMTLVSTCDVAMPSAPLTWPMLFLVEDHTLDHRLPRVAQLPAVAVIHIVPPCYKLVVLMAAVGRATVAAASFTHTPSPCPTSTSIAMSRHTPQCPNKYHRHVHTYYKRDLRSSSYLFVAVMHPRPAHSREKTWAKHLIILKTGMSNQ